MAELVLQAVSIFNCNLYETVNCNHNYRTI